MDVLAGRRRREEVIAALHRHARAVTGYDLSAAGNPADPTDPTDLTP
jgi:hypothetical protein